MLVIRNQQLQVLQAAIDERLLDAMSTWLHRRYPRTVAELPDEALRAQLRQGLREADAAGVPDGDRKWFAMARVLLGAPLETTDWGTGALDAGRRGDPDAGSALMNTLQLHVDLDD